MVRRVLVVVICLLFVGVAAAPAEAQDVDEIAGELDFRTYYVESDDRDLVNELDSLLARTNAETETPTFYVVVLRTEVDDAERLADAILARTPTKGTVLVLTPDQVGARSDVLGVDEVNNGLDRLLEENDTISRISAFVDGTEASASADEGGGGGFNFLWLLIPVAGVVAWLVFRSRKGKQEDVQDLDQARAEIRQQLTVVAHQIVELGDTVTVSENDQAEQYYREASATYAAVEEAVDGAATFVALAELADRADWARWQMEAAEALIEGRDLPPEPEPDKPAACFFDPTHRPGVEAATVRTAAGSKEVQVCRDCAAKLERGERPTPRQIPVGRQRVPAGKAPRSHGGGGLGGLGMFEVILGGLGAVLGQGGGGRGGMGVPHDWTSSGGGGGVAGRSRRRSGGDLTGPVRVPGRRSPVPNRTRGGRRGGARVGGRRRL